MPRLLIHFARYGPYHHARLRAAHQVLSPLGWEVIGLETAGTDATYAWDESKAAARLRRCLSPWFACIKDAARPLDICAPGMYSFSYDKNPYPAPRK